MADLMDTLIALDASHAESDGTGTYIRRNGKFLSGMPYLWSIFGERAFVFPSKTVAEQLVSQYAEQLAGAEVCQRAPAATGNSVWLFEIQGD